MRSNTIAVTLSNPEQDKLFRQLVSAVETLGTKVERLTQALSHPDTRQQLRKSNPHFVSLNQNGCCQEENK